MSSCGIGGWGGPLPGDPSNNSILSATPAFGGIDVNWTYPTTNPYAVSYVKLYRGTTSSFGSALLIAEVGGAHYYDKLDTATLYYYWIKIVSANGTEGELIGPASAVAKPAIEDMIEQLTGQIDDGYLATSLKDEIAKITSNYAELQQEILDRIAQGETLSLAVSDLDDAVQETLAYIGTEMATRASGDSALALQISTVAALNDTTAALVDEERLARISADAALALRVDEVEAAMDGDGAAAAADILVAKIGYSATNDAYQRPYDGDGATIVYSVGTYPTVDYPEYAADRTRIIDKQGVTNWNLTAAGIAKPLIWVRGMPMASAVRRVGVTGPDGSFASLETAMTAQSTLNGNFKALYTAKVNVNGLVGGFGIYNDGVVVEAGFDVDKFWIGRTSGDKRKPFIVDSGVVYIDEAAINKLTFSKLRDESGSFIVQDGKVKADYISGKGLTITDSLGNIILNAGASTFTGNVTGQVGGTAVGTLNTNVTTALANASTAITNAATAQGTANSAVTGLATRLRTDAQNVLAGPGGLATGTLTWNSVGERTGGYGVGLTQKGLVAYNSGGNVTFTLDGTTGAATFAGALSAATGTFAGSLSAASGTFAGTLTAAAINAVNTINIAGNAVSANATVSGTATTISTNIVVPSGETYQILGIGFQVGTHPDSGGTTPPGPATLTIARGAGSFSTSIPNVVVKLVPGEADTFYWGYSGVTLAGVDILTAGTHTVSLTGISGMSKTLLVLINKR